jgi:manganese-dependent inorganic pyrophosphatase
LVLVSRPAEQAVTADCKEYIEQGRRFSVAQIEEIGFTQFWERKDEVLDAVRAYAAEKGYYLAALLVTDVVSQTSLLVMAAPEAFLNMINYPEVEESIYRLEGVVSRKKQLLPFLTHCLAQIK